VYSKYFRLSVDSIETWMLKVGNRAENSDDWCNFNLGSFYDSKL
jgi:hypothetical protein